MKRSMIVLVVAAVAFAAGTASADLSNVYGFSVVTGNATNAAIGAAQLSVTVTPVAGFTDQALFTFSNVGSAPCSITDVYFQDGTLLSMGNPVDGPGVQFTAPATPGNLPGGNNVNFYTTQQFSADSDAPVQPNGVNPGESLGVPFILKPGNTYDSVLQALAEGLNGPVEGRTLRIGVHVQGFADGGSASFINSQPVPAPASIVLVPIGLGLLGMLKRKLA